MGSLILLAVYTEMCVCGGGGGWTSLYHHSTHTDGRDQIKLFLSVYFGFV